MKTFLSGLSLLAILFFCVDTRGQNGMEIAHYLNGEKYVGGACYVNPNRMKSIRVIKTPELQIHIKTQGNEFSFLTIKDVVEKYTDLNYGDNRIAYRINDEWIAQRDEVKIDDTFHIYLKVDELKNLKYLSPPLQELTVVDIKLEREPRPLRIRGNAKRYLRRHGMVGNL